MIRTENVTKIFGDEPEKGLELLQRGKTKDEIKAEAGQVVGVSNATFEVQVGEIFGIMGLSGSGKSTLIRCINCLIEPTAGRVFFQTNKGSTEITALDKKQLRSLRTNHMSMVFQHFGLFPHRTVLRNVTYGLEIQGQEKAKRERIAQETLELVGLSEWGEAFPSELSGGMQQRVGLARALAAQSEVMLMDEPFSALDPLIKVQMQDELIKIQKEIKRTILFITHDLDEAMRVGNRIGIMDAGVIVQIGTPEDILVNPHTEYVANFVKNADPTDVLTAGTLVLPLNHEKMSVRSSEDGAKVYHRQDSPNIHYKVDREGGLQEMRIGGSPIQVKTLGEVLSLNEIPSQVREDVGLSVGKEAVISKILRGRRYSRLPTVVLNEKGQMVGVINERDLIYGILEKRKPESTDEEEGESGKISTEPIGNGKGKTIMEEQ